MSLVQELQRDAIGSTVSTSELLRKALIVARKLGVREFSEWIEHELKGYTDLATLPEYRNLRGEVMAQNPVRGLIPVHISPQALADVICKHPIFQPLAEVESLTTSAQQNPHSVLSMAFSADQMAVIYNNLQTNMQYPLVLITSASHMESVVQAVRNAILEWSLKLEEDGIVGEGLSFSKEEKQVAASNQYHIKNYIENMNQSQIQQETHGSTQIYNYFGFDAEAAIHLLREFGEWLQDAPLPQEQKAEVIADLQTVESQINSPKPKGAIIQAGLSSIRTILEGAAGSVLATEAPQYAMQIAAWLEKLQQLMSSLGS